MEQVSLFCLEQRLYNIENKSIETYNICLKHPKTISLALWFLFKLSFSGPDFLGVNWWGSPQIIQHGFGDSSFEETPHFMYFGHLHI